MSLDPTRQNYLDNLIQQHQVVLFMKGTPQHPLCGFSGVVCKVLNMFQTAFHSVNVLEDPSLREDIKLYSRWPTIPQLYVQGVFVGGCDIVQEMYHNGELEKLLKNL
jgi:monothiol glutaredoxin